MWQEDSVKLVLSSNNMLPIANLVDVNMCRCGFWTRSCTAPSFSISLSLISIHWLAIELHFTTFQLYFKSYRLQYWSHPLVSKGTVVHNSSLVVNLFQGIDLLSLVLDQSSFKYSSIMCLHNF